MRYDPAPITSNKALELLGDFISKLYVELRGLFERRDLLVGVNRNAHIEEILQRTVCSNSV